MSVKQNSATADGNEQNPPLWRQHFPVDMHKDKGYSRREFLGGVTVASGAMACGRVAQDQLSPSHEATANDEIDTREHTPLALERKFDELEVGESFKFHYPNEKSPCILVKLSHDTFVAYEQKCTHLACPVVPSFEANEFHCPCHHGIFDLRSGHPTAGPPREPLRRVPISKSSDGTLWAGVQDPRCT